MKVSRILFIILLFLTCRERTNIFDIKSDDFAAPPHLDAWLAVGYYDPQSGNLVGVGIQIDATEEFSKTLPLYHEFYQDVSLRTDFEISIERGETGYGVEIFGPYEAGPYSLEINFGGMPVGACIFWVTENDGRSVLREQVTCANKEMLPDAWFYRIR